MPVYKSVLNSPLRTLRILAYMSTVAQVQISSLVMCVTVSASVALCLLFGPKMYLVLLHPEKCARTYPGNKKPTSNTKTNKVSTTLWGL